MSLFKKFTLIAFLPFVFDIIYDILPQSLSVMDFCGSHFFRPIFLDVVAIKASENDIKVQLYPNPSRDYLTLDMQTDGRESVKVTALNVMGEKVYEHTYDRSGICVIDVSRWSKGPYLFCVRAGRGSELLLREKLMIR